MLRIGLGVVYRTPSLVQFILRDASCQKIEIRESLTALVLVLARAMHNLDG